VELLRNYFTSTTTWRILGHRGLVVHSHVDAFVRGVDERHCAGNADLPHRGAVDTGGDGLSAIKVDIAQKTSTGPGSRSGRIKFSQQNVRLGVVVIP